ncbi:ABC transporter substrate-binding protein [Bradyrhizobium sp. USDA 336]|uniref:ABC transporter substrate-binding protein n=1 Tax=Bradyrhizobium sp. USDA 336 TaxID=3156311 RepID=UPI0038331FCF
MRHAISRRRTIKFLSLATVSVALALAQPVQSIASDQVTTLRVVLGAEVKIVDPIATTATESAIHGMMVFDTLFGLDADLRPQPQMVNSFSVSENRRIYSFTLREGLSWSDGAPVTAQDCVASLKRWGAKDGAAQILFANITNITAVSPQTFTIELSKHFEPLLDLLAKSGPIIPFMMPRRLAETDPNKRISETIGSGPFLFKQDEWVPGNKLVYVKNPHYIPRDEPASGTAGGKRALVDRVEFLTIADPQTAFAALRRGEIDFLSEPAPDYLPMLRSDPNIGTGERGRIGSQGMIRLNHLQPPFDKLEARLAMEKLVDQQSMMRALGLGEHARECWAVFGCGSALEMVDGRPTRDIGEAKKLFLKAGYRGEPIVLLNATDNAALDAAALVLAQEMREAGLNVDLQSMDWGTLVQRRENKGPRTDGGWNIFLTSLSGPPVTNPLTHPGITASCDKAWYGWPCDPQIEDLRLRWPHAQTEEARRIAGQIQQRVYSEGIYIPFGQWSLPFAYRKDRLTGVLEVPNLNVFWNINKSAGR